MNPLFVLCALFSLLSVRAVEVEAAEVEPSVVSVGKGSYASFPPASTGKDVQQVLARPLYLTDENPKRALPTNQWWTNLLVDKFAGQLWAFPHQVKADERGLDFTFPTVWNGEGRDPISDFPIQLRGDGFKPQDARAKTWGDWTLTFRLAENRDKFWDVTIGRGLPYIWMETQGVAPQLQVGNDATFFDKNGKTSPLPKSGDVFGITYANRSYGVFAPDNTRFEFKNGQVSVQFSGDKTFLVLCPLPTPQDIATFYRFAFAIPRDSRMNWVYQAEKAQVTTGWHLTTETLKGTEKRVLQGWLPHHWRDTIHDLKFDKVQFRTPRGDMKCAVGTDFRVIYGFSGVPPFLPAPKPTELANDFDAARMRDYLARYATKDKYGDDTYWGGKSLLQLAQYMMAARELNDPSFAKLRDNLRIALVDWLSYAPGEKAHFFARYPKWNALVGFNSSYGSEAFNDHHFHYGYFSTAGAMLALVDANFRRDYGPMLRLVAKEYANWQRDDPQFPFLRTFDVWEGHSWAGGFSSPTGNNQESSSEAVQSWAGLFWLGQALNDKEMTATGAMGYATETRATMEYWFNIHGDNFSPNYKWPIVGMVWSGGQMFGTYFSGDPAWVYAIQWLPMSPALSYLTRDAKWAKNSLNSMLAMQEKHAQKSGIQPLGAALGNVVLAHQSQFDADAAAATMNQLWDAKDPIAHENDTPGLTYFHTHANRTLGEIQWNFHMNLPMSRVYLNPRTKTYTYTVFNPSTSAQNVTVYRDNVAVGTLNAPEGKLSVAQTLLPLRK